MTSGFAVYRAEGETELQKVFRLRYKVYCREWGFEKPENNPGGLETDEYDKNEVHFYAKNTKGKGVGTVRLILESPEGFPIDKHCTINAEEHRISRSSLAEISRLAIRRDCRRRRENRLIYGPDEERRSVGSLEFSEMNYRDGAGSGVHVMAPLKGNWPAFDRR